MFGAGCFWGVESAFRKLKGVTNVTVGYSGGTKEHPSYEDVCSDKTGHAEVALVEYNPEVISISDLLTTFWSIHDPTSLNQQGPDIGSQYRSAIYFYNQEHEPIIKDSLTKQSQILNKEIVTEVLEAGDFWKAEEYHQCYLEKKKSQF